MKIQLPAAQRTLYSLLFVSRLDFDKAAFALNVILKKGWHYTPWERRGTVYGQQTVYTTSLVVSYARPFIGSRGRNKFPRDLWQFTPTEETLHRHLMDLRNSIFAHSQGEYYSVIPWRHPEFSTDIVGEPIMRVTKDDAAELKQMIRGLSARAERRLKEILPDGPFDPSRKYS